MVPALKKLDRMIGRFLLIREFQRASQPKIVSIQISANWVEIQAREKLNRRHMVDIPRNPFFAQRRYRANWPFMDGY